MRANAKFWSWGICPLLLRVISFSVLDYCSSQVGVGAVSVPKSLAGGLQDTIHIPILKKLMDGASAEKLKELVKSHPAINPAANPKEFRSLMSKLGPIPGALDPVMQDMLEAFERTHRDTTAVLRQTSTERMQYPDDATSNRVASSTEENGIIWNDAISRPHKRDRDSNRFSSRYRSNNHTGNHGGVFAEYANYDHYDYDQDARSNSNSTHGSKVNATSNIPFNHVTDPNLRNHRLYAWEFETYKNFTHIDQAEDLMADEDIATETKISPVQVAPPINPPNNQLQQHPNAHPIPDQIAMASNSNKTTTTVKVDPSAHLWQPPSTKSKRVKVKGIPHIVISLEDTSDHNQFPGYNFQLDSGEHSSGQRPREQLRQSSTENVVYVHGSGEEGARYPFTDMEDGEGGGHDHYSRRFPGLRTNNYRNPTEPSDAMFIDPDQDFFTSTVRSDQEISSETMPKRRRKKLKKVKKEELDEASSNRFSNRMGDRFMEEEDSHPGVSYSPMYSKNNLQGSLTGGERARSHYSSGPNIYQTPGPHLPFMRPTPKYFHMGGDRESRYKQDRILNAEGTSGSSGGGGSGAGTGTGNGGDEAASPSNFEAFDAAQLSHLSDGGHIGNYYSLHPNGGADIGLHSNLGGTGGDIAFGSKNHPFGNPNHDPSSQEYQGGGGGGHKSRLQNVIGALIPFATPLQANKKLQSTPTDQIIAPGNLEDFYHPYAEADHQVNQYPDESTIAVSWSNTWYIVGAIVAFTAVLVLLLPSLVAPHRMGKKDTRNDLDEDDFNTSTYQGSGSNNQNTYHYDNTQNDVQQNSDLWTEVKGVYNDLVNLFRGDYSLLNKYNKKQNDGPKIVYRDEEGDEEDSDEEEDDEKERVTLRNRKREQYLKKQQQMLKKQQQQHNKLSKQQNHPHPHPQQQNQNQGKSSGVVSKKTLVSKAKVSTATGTGARDNKESTGKTIEASSVNNLVVVSGPGPSIPVGRMAENGIEIDKEEKNVKPEKKQEQSASSPRAVTGFYVPENTTMATMALFNHTGYQSLYGTGPDGLSPFLREWAQVQLINGHN